MGQVGEECPRRLNLSIRMVFQQVGHERLKRVQPPFNLKENKRTSEEKTRGIFRDVGILKPIKPMPRILYDPL